MTPLHILTIAAACFALSTLAGLTIGAFIHAGQGPHHAGGDAEEGLGGVHAHSDTSRTERHHA